MEYFCKWIAEQTSNFNRKLNNFRKSIIHFQEHSLEKIETSQRITFLHFLVYQFPWYCAHKKKHISDCTAPVSPSHQIAETHSDGLAYIPLAQAPTNRFVTWKSITRCFFFLPPSIRASQNRPTMMVAGKPHRYEGEAAAAGGTKLNPKPTNCIMLTKVRVVIGFPSEFKRLDRIGCLCLVAFLAVWW